MALSGIRSCLGRGRNLLFYVNGVRYEVDFEKDKVQPDETLLEFLRRKCGLTGSKLACGEGGCGCCTVEVAKFDPTAQRFVRRPVNSCLCYIGSVDGASITTVEGLKGKGADGQETLHPVQKHMAHHFGSQCGFCTPGFVMAIQTHLSEHPDQTSPDQIYHCLDGNLCRCTGYRPIADAVQAISQEFSSATSSSSSSSSFSSSSSSSSSKKSFSVFPIPPELIEKYGTGTQPSALRLQGSRAGWTNPSTLKELLQLLKENPQARIVSGGTEVCIENRIGGRVQQEGIGVQDLRELKEVKWDTPCPDAAGSHSQLGLGVSLGANIPLSDIMHLLEHRKQTVASERGKSSTTASAILDILQWFSGNSIRNVATMAGNIMTASPISDLNPIFVATGAFFQLASLDDSGNVSYRWVSARSFFGPKYKQVAAQHGRDVLTSVWIPYHDGPNTHVLSYKQAKRREDDISLVNGCLAFTLDPATRTIQGAQLAFGGMGPAVVTAPKTAQNALGRSFTDRHTLHQLTADLASELALPSEVPGGMPEYRLSLVLAFMQKYWLRINHELGTGVVRPEELSVFQPLTGFDTIPSGRQDYTSPSPLRVVGTPVIHASAERQVTGEAIYTDDLPRLPLELQGALVLSKCDKGKIVSIDTSEAEKIPGFRGFFSRSSVPGSNKIGDIVHDEDLFADGEVSTYAQIIGVVVCDDELDARRAASLVRVQYAPDPHPIGSIEEAVAAKSFLPDSFAHRIQKGTTPELEQSLASAPHRVRGSVRCGGQEHFYFEPNVSLAVPTDSEIHIYPSSQNLNKTQLTVSSVLGQPAHRIKCAVRRIGGGFGGKETDSIKFSAVAAVAAYHLKRPVRLLIPRDQDFETTGKRHAFMGRYDVAFDGEGRVHAADVELYSNAGNWTDLSFPVLDRALFHADNSYQVDQFRVRGEACRTNTVSNTAYRGFGGPQGMLVAEGWIEHIAHTLNKRPEEIREKNLYPSPESRTHFGQKLEVDLPRLWRQAKESFGYEENLQQVKEFNGRNKYVKQGLSLLPTKFGLAFTATFLNQGSALINIYTDGSVLISHGGVEMGQGLHTKCQAIAAEALGIDISKVYISESATDKVPNASPSAASMSSDIYGMAVLNGCQELLKRLEKYRPATPSLSWLETAAKKAYFDRVSLSTVGFHKVPVDGYNMVNASGTPFRYFTSGVAMSRVELDSTTGDFRVLSSDVLMDVGSSINPLIDIGQIEGAFVQGLGWSTMEELVWNDGEHKWATPAGHARPSGRLLTRGPGAYKIPSLDDIPRRFNVSLSKDSPNPHAVFSSRGIGEPPFFLGASVYFALRDAIRATQETPAFWPIEIPYTSERIRMSASQDPLARLVVADPPSFVAKGSF